MPQDGRGNTYFDVENIRITCVPETFDGNPGLRIQAYKGQGNALFPGAEIPIPDKSTAFDLLKTISKALEANGL
ncbi:MAG: hypothetical protein DRI57_30170 [Deltaproteobacteria bacterium]|nr:MAG: hypothetical protein DRI57_30170 [Deltaproteobacteria bacterium]